MKNNIFMVGSVAEGKSFFGRTKEIEKLEEAIFTNEGVVHLVGAPKIGKSSLVNKVIEKNRKRNKKIICVQIDMSPCQNAYDFWVGTLADKIKDSLTERQLEDKFREYYQKIESLDASDSMWYMRFKSNFFKLLRKMKDEKLRVVLIIDEFDAAGRIFGQDGYYYSLLRSIFYEPNYNVNGMIVSRRRLHLFEANCDSISPFHNIFNEMPLRGFNENDMDIFYEKLADYDIGLSDDEKKKMEYYTGKIPYLCCMFANEMVQSRAGGKTVNILEIFREYLPQINVYYGDLIKRLEEDGHKHTADVLALTSKFPRSVTDRDIENLKAMGVIVLQEDDEGNISYCLYCEDFMRYLKMTPLKLPLWDTMMMTEGKLKKLLGEKYPDLVNTTYSMLKNNSGIIANLNQNFSELALDWNTINRYSLDLNRWKNDPAIIDVLTMSKVVGIIKGQWNQKFAAYFAKIENARTKLECIAKIRNPMSHNSIEYVSDEELAACIKYCEEINKLFA